MSKEPRIGMPRVEGGGEERGNWEQGDGEPQIPTVLEHGR